MVLWQRLGAREPSGGNVWEETFDIDVFEWKHLSSMYRISCPGSYYLRSQQSMSKGKPMYI